MNWPSEVLHQMIRTGLLSRQLKMYDVLIYEYLILFFFAQADISVVDRMALHTAVASV